MTDRLEGAKPDEQDEAGDPAQAFDTLRRTVEDLLGDLTREMTTIRKGVEAAFEKFQQPIDYGPDLGRIVQQLAVVGQHLEAVQKTPALRNDPDHYARALENAAERVSGNAARMIEARGQSLERVSSALGGYVRNARLRGDQNWWVCSAGVAGLVAGMLLTLFLPRALPGSVDMAVASTVMNADRWHAGISLTQSANARGWRSIVDASNLVSANREVLTACTEMAAKAKKDQRCTITVAVPEK
jgi:hypothetical protein